MRTGALAIFLAVIVGFFEGAATVAVAPNAKSGVPPTPAFVFPDGANGVTGVDHVHVLDDQEFSIGRSQFGKFAHTVRGDHEDAGFFTASDTAFEGIAATHVIYLPKDFHLDAPLGAKGTQTLYAPTTRPPNGSCLEVGTAYTTRPGSQTDVRVYVFDFCNGNKFVAEVPVDAKFFETYTFDVGKSSRAYRMLILTDAKHPGLPARWSASLFNVETGQWDVLYLSVGISKDIRGWIIFETWYQPGQCSKSLPPLSARDIMYRNQLTMEWVASSLVSSAPSTSVHTGALSSATNVHCFVNGDAGGASYLFRSLNNGGAWEVVSTGQ